MTLSVSDRDRDRRRVAGRNRQGIGRRVLDLEDGAVLGPDAVDDEVRVGVRRDTAKKDVDPPSVLSGGVADVSADGNVIIAVTVEVENIQVAILGEVSAGDLADPLAAFFRRRIQRYGGRVS